MRKILSYCLVSIISLFAMINVTFAGYMDACNTMGGGKLDIDPKIGDTVHIVILIIQITVPVLLVVFGSIDFLKAITSGKEDEIKKGQQIFIRRIITGVLVFFIIAIVKLLVTFVAGDESANISNCMDCFLNGSKTQKCQTKYSNPTQTATDTSPGTTKKIQK